MRKLHTILIAFLLSLPMMAQKISVDVEIDSIQIFVGEQTALHLSVAVKDGQQVKFPMFQPQAMIVPGVEVVGMLPCDTQRIDDQFIRVRAHYMLTSFDDTLYRIPPMPVNVDGKKYESKALALKVLTIPVDTLHPNQFFPQKDVQDNPFLWSEWSHLLIMGGLILIIFILCILMYMRLKSNKPIVLTVRIIKRIPPHQKALNSIEEIKTHKETYNADDAKVYYTQLTETLRRYMMERFGFNAMEMTSSEIIERLRQEKSQEKIEELTMLFETADLVKFAKYNTAVTENDRNLISAVNFINTTKTDATVTEERVEPTATEEQKQTIRARISLKWGIAVLTVVAIALIVYTIWQLISILG